MQYFKLSRKLMMITYLKVLLLASAKLLIFCFVFGKFSAALSIIEKCASKEFIFTLKARELEESEIERADGAREATILPDKSTDIMNVELCTVVEEIVKNYYQSAAHALIRARSCICFPLRAEAGKISRTITWVLFSH